MGPREGWRGRNPQAHSWWGGESGQRRGMMLHAEPAILGDVQLGIGSLGTRSWQGLGQGPRGHRAGPEAPGRGHWLWHRYQAPNWVLSAIGAAGALSCTPCPGERGATSPIWPPSRERAENSTCRQPPEPVCPRVTTSSTVPMPMALPRRPNLLELFPGISNDWQAAKDRQTQRESEKDRDGGKGRHREV